MSFKDGHSLSVVGESIDEAWSKLHAIAALTPSADGAGERESAQAPMPTELPMPKYHYQQEGVGSGSVTTVASPSPATGVQEQFAKNAKCSATGEVSGEDLGWLWTIRGHADRGRCTLYASDKVRIDRILAALSRLGSGKTLGEELRVFLEEDGSVIPLAAPSVTSPSLDAGSATPSEGVE